MKQTTSGRLIVAVFFVPYPLAASGDRNILAWEPEREYVHGFYFVTLYLGNISEVLHVWKPRFRDRYRVRLDLCGPHGNPTAHERCQWESSRTVE